MMLFGKMLERGGFYTAKDVMFYGEGKATFPSIHK